MSQRTEQIRAHFDALARNIAKWRRRNSYYHDDQTKYFRYLVGENKRILELGSGTGELLHALQPSVGVGVDISPATVEIARNRFAALNFMVGDAGRLDTLPENTFADWKSGKLKFRTHMFDEAGIRSTWMESKPDSDLRKTRLVAFKSIRAGLDLSQSEMAAALHVATKTLQGWEIGKPIPDPIYILAELIRDFPGVRKRLLAA